MTRSKSPTQRLAEWRAAQQLSLVKAAVLFGVRGPTLHDWERGKKRPRDAHRDVIEAIVGIPREDWRNERESELVARVEAAPTARPGPKPSVVKRRPRVARRSDPRPEESRAAG